MTELLGKDFKGTHTMRKVYGQWSYQVYGTTQMQKLAWLKLVLGHTSSSTSRAYESVLIIPIVQAESKAQAALLSEQQTLIDVLYSDMHDMALLMEEKVGGLPDKLFAWFKVEGRWIKFPRVSRENDGPDRKLLRMRASAGELRAKGIPVKPVSMQRIGYGSEAVKAYFLDP